MRFEIIICTVCECGYFSPTKWKEIFKIPSTTRIMRKSIFWDFYKSNFFSRESEYFRKESLLFFEPIFKDSFIGSGLAEIFNLYLFKFAGTEYEILWSDFITEGLSTLSYSEWNLFTAGSSDICKVYEYSLSSFWSKIDKTG